MPDESKLVHFPGSEIAPKALLLTALERADDLESVIVIAKFKNNGSDVWYSTQSVNELTFAAAFLSHRIFHPTETTNVHTNTRDNEPDEGA